MNKFIHSKKKIMFFGGIGIGALLLACGVIFVTTFLMSPKKRIYKALMNTYGRADILSGYVEKGGTLTVDADVSGANGSINAKLLETTDKASMKKGGKIELSQGGKTVLSSDYVMGQDGAYLSVDGVTDGYVQFENNGGSGQRAQGGQLTGIIDRLWRNAEVESAGNGSVTNGVKKIKCKKYKVTISASDINSMLKEMSQAKQSEGGNSQGGAVQLLQAFFNGASMQDSAGGMMPGQDSSGFGGMMPGQDSSGFGGMMPGQENTQQGELVDVSKLLESGVSSDLVLTIYMDKSSIRAFVADVSFADDASTSIKVASKNKGVDKVTSSTEWTVSLVSATDEDDIYLDVEALDGKVDIAAEASLTKSGQQILSGTGNIQLDTDIESDELDKASNVIAMNQVDQSKVSAKKQDVMSALSVLRDGQNQSPMMGSPEDNNGGYSFDYGFGGQGGSSGFGQGGQGMTPGMGPGMGSGMGPGMGPGMGGMMPGMMPGMYPD